MHCPHATRLIPFRSNLMLIEILIGQTKTLTIIKGSNFFIDSKYDLPTIWMPSWRWQSTHSYPKRRPGSLNVYLHCITHGDACRMSSRQPRSCGQATGLHTKTIVDLNWRHGHRSHDKYGHHTEIYRFLQLHPVETNRMAFQGLTLAGVLVRTNWKDIHLHPISRHIDNATISLSLRIERPRCIRSLETEACSLKNPPFNVAECWRFIDADSITGIWMHALGYECVQCVHWDMNAFTVQSSNRVGPIKIGQWHWLSIACPKDFVT